MMVTMKSHRPLAITMLAAGLALAACGGSSDGIATPAVETDSAPTETDAPVETEAPVETDPAPVETEAPVETDAPVDTAPEPVVTEAAEEDTSTASCLIGEWVVTEAEMNGYYDALEATLGVAGPAPTFEITGQSLLTFTATEYMYDADFTLLLDVVGQEGTGDATGTVTGEYTVVGDRIDAQITSSDLDVVVNVGGVTLSGSELANGLLNTAPINRAPVSCDGPTIGFALGDPEDPESLRHDVLLTPA